MSANLRVLLVAAAVAIAAAFPSWGDGAQILRNGDRTWIGGVPPFRWEENGRTTFIGALAVALQVMGEATDYDTLLGDSGLAFRVRWWRRGDKRITGWPIEVCAGQGQEELDLLRRATGWRLRTRDVSHHEKPDISRYVPEIIDSIEEGKPVIAYGTRANECGLILGYAGAGERLLVRDYFTGASIAWPSPQELGGFLALLEEKGEASTARNAVLTALATATRNWHREPVLAWQVGEAWTAPNEKIYYGRRAYDEWMHDIKVAGAFDEERRMNLALVNGLNMHTLLDARQAAVRYLTVAAPMFAPEVQQALRHAAEGYAELARVAQSAMEGEQAFFGPRSNKTLADWTFAVRQKELSTLQKVRELDEQAAQEVTRALALVFLSADRTVP